MTTTKLTHKQRIALVTALEPLSVFRYCSPFDKPFIVKGLIRGQWIIRTAKDNVQL